MTGRSARATSTSRTGTRCARATVHIDIRTGRPLTLPAVFPVETFPVVVEDGVVKVDLR